MRAHAYGIPDAQLDHGDIYVNEFCRKCELCRSTAFIERSKDPVVLYYPVDFDPDGNPSEVEPPCKGTNVLYPDKIKSIQELATAGASIREIASSVGVNRETVHAYVGPRDKSTGLRRWHARRKAEGRPILPPWRR